MVEKKFNQKDYIKNYIKEHKRQFKVDLNINEMIELNILLDKHNLTKAQFLRNAIKELREKWSFYFKLDITYLMCYNCLLKGVNFYACYYKIRWYI